MIGRLRGILVDKQAPHLLLEVQGVGYEIEAPMSTFYDLPALGMEVTLFTHLLVREDAHVLCGFATTAERALFRSLIRVSGVGAKLALAILSGISAEGFARCVQNQDAATLTRLPGIGKKTAERLIIEMRDRLENFAGGSDIHQSRDAGSARLDSPIEDAVSALVSLGYKPPEASRLVRAVDCVDLPSEEIIRRALQAAVKM